MKRGPRRPAQIPDYELVINERIRAPKVLLIDDEGNKVGVMMTRDALDRAREASLDLVEVAPSADPPVARIMDYGKYLYIQQKKARETKKKTSTSQLKEIKLRTKTEDHDLQTKMKKAKEFLENGDKVKIRIMYRGREMAHQELGWEMLEKVHKELEDYGQPVDRGEMQGRNLIEIIVPFSKSQLQKKKGKEPKQDKEEKKENEPAEQSAEEGA